MEAERRADPEADAEQNAILGLIQITKKENRVEVKAGEVGFNLFYHSRNGDLGLCIISFSSGHLT